MIVWWPVLYSSQMILFQLSSFPFLSAPPARPICHVEKWSLIGCNHPAALIWDFEKKRKEKIKTYSNGSPPLTKSPLIMALIFLPNSLYLFMFLYHFVFLSFFPSVFLSFIWSSIAKLDPIGWEKSVSQSLEVIGGWLRSIEGLSRWFKTHCGLDGMGLDGYHRS